jgi:2-methylisocitrate lyase-like PEP mutase family enzyme
LRRRDVEFPAVTSFAELAERLRALHRPGQPLLLANVWDVATARLIERAGFPAIATTSAGIAFSRGYPDGEKIPRDEMLAEIGRICRAVSVPVTADLEAGYGDSPEAVAEAAARALEAGAVGLNLEDGTGRRDDPLFELGRQVEKIRAIREAGRRRGVAIVVNARTDVYLDRVGPEGGRLEETIRRGGAFRGAGADCAFVPGVTDPKVIGELVRRLACPVNVLAAPGGPSIGELAKLGVARVSLGSGAMRAALSLVERIGEELRTRGTYSALDGALSHASINELMQSPTARR